MSLEYHGVSDTYVWKIDNKESLYFDVNELEGLKEIFSEARKL